ncbi:Heterokaryon incompatibility, partial [Metarhizium hybridum]
MESLDVSTFVYFHLDMDVPHTFRILDVHPGQRDDPLRCTLRHVRQDEGSQCKYAGLSYAWGDPSVTSDIMVNDARHTITRNLEIALRGLRDSSATLTLWVDAICINQMYIPEKNDQVRHMQTIYANADKVILWLGEASSESDRAIIFLKHVCARLEQAGIVPEESLDPQRYVEKDFLRGLGDYLEPAFDEDWEAVAQLFMRPWWTRAWIVQELVAARTAEFRCGSTTISWPVLALSISLLAHCKMPITQFPHPLRVSCARDRAWSMLYIKHDFAVKGSVDFLRLLDHRRRNCADLRDKIYSLLGMTNEFTRARLRPDYSAPVAEVFAAALASDIDEHQDLEVLSFVDHLDDPGEYPSWVADLARGPETWRFYKYWPPPPTFKWTPASPISFSDDFRTLYVDGYEIDTLQDAKVQDTEEPLQRRTTQTGRGLEWTWDLERIVDDLAAGGPLQAARAIPDSATPEVLRRSVQRIVYETLIAGQLSTSNGWIRHQVRYADEDTNPSESPMSPSSPGAAAAPSAPKLLSVASRHIGLAPSGNTVGAACQAEQPAKEALVDRPLDEVNILKQACSQTLGRSLLLSKARFLGLGPVISQPGDAMFVLFGLREAAVLRAREDGSYMFVGTAYFHGFMEGQNLRDFEVGRFCKKRLAIR